MGVGGWGGEGGREESGKGLLASNNSSLLSASRYQQRAE